MLFWLFFIVFWDLDLDFYWCLVSITYFEKGVLMGIFGFALLAHVVVEAEDADVASALDWKCVTYVTFCLVGLEIVNLF